MVLLFCGKTAIVSPKSLMWSRKNPGWWARQDSNLQPDRYERPALTIELQAPSQVAAQQPAADRLLYYRRWSGGATARNSSIPSSADCGERWRG